VVDHLWKEFSMAELVRTARMTGLFYLGLAIAGAVSFLVIRPRLFADGDPQATLTHLTENVALARVGVAAEMLVVVMQALVAMWFYRRFRAVDAFGAASIAAFGLVNAIAILGSAACLAMAVDVSLHPVGDAAVTVQLLYLYSGSIWSVAAMFFGLWLIPMGSCVVRTRWMPRALGWVLVGGGAGYLLSAFVGRLAPAASAVAGALTVPATIGEFWMVAYLLVRGVRRTREDSRPTGQPEVQP
jgi:Domain of unknown function (DUF4386)